VRGLAELLAERTQDERDRARLGVMLGEVDRLDGILGEYLALARPLDHLAPTPTDLATLVREVAAIAEARAERAQIHLSVEAEPVTVAVDPRRIKEALLNLVLNALDHTPAGGRVTLRVQPRSGEGALLCVEDTGPGMTPAQLAAAGTAYISGRAGGTGLGLALVRQTVSQHGGALDLSSAPGRGTVARVALPAAPPASQPSPEPT
jgi:signal transduction histidine kinase